VENLYRLLVKTNAHFKISGGRVFPPLDEKIKAEIAKHYSGKELEVNYALLLTPTSIDILQREENDLLELMQKQNLTDLDLLKHAEKYALHFYNTYDRKIVLSFLRKRVSEEGKAGRKHFKYLEGLKRKKKSIRKRQLEIEDKLKGAGIISIAKFLRFQGSLRFDMKDHWAGAEYRCLTLFEEIAKRGEVPLMDLIDGYKVEDYKALLLEGKKLEADELRKRKKNYAWIKLGKLDKFATGNEAERSVRHILGSTEKEVLELKGTPACAGIGEGRVRIVSAAGLVEVEEALAHFKEGDVLITTMTQPNMIFLMKKASAIVTDQGGMTSHAAIASRELGVPCVVGTIHGTKWLKDGDLVRVDANTGIVRKLK
jgi:phosphoenolpyruvate synthase/pyruvate phosphate dikinase